MTTATDLGTWLATIAGGGGILVAIAGGLLYVTRNAIATAVHQAGAREIERLKGELAQALEKERQAFAREVQRETHAAARALEQFKAQLTLEAEVRRQVASRRVDALVGVVNVGQTLAVDLNEALASPSADAATASLLTLMAEYRLAVGRAAPLLRPEVVSKLELYGDDVSRDVQNWRRTKDLARFKGAMGRVHDLLALARSEMFVEGPDAKVSSAQAGSEAEAARHRAVIGGDEP
jgi:hypothetical protein